MIENKTNKNVHIYEVRGENIKRKRERERERERESFQGER